MQVKGRFYAVKTKDNDVERELRRISWNAFCHHATSITEPEKLLFKTSFFAR